MSHSTCRSHIVSSRIALHRLPAPPDPRPFQSSAAHTPRARGLFSSAQAFSLSAHLRLRLHLRSQWIRTSLHSSASVIPVLPFLDTCSPLCPRGDPLPLFISGHHAHLSFKFSGFISQLAPGLRPPRLSPRSHCLPLLTLRLHLLVQPKLKVPGKPASTPMTQIRRRSNLT